MDFRKGRQLIMRRVAFALLFVVLSVALAAAQAPHGAPVPATYQLRIAGPVYFPNGDIKGDPLVVPFGKFGEAIRVEVGNGPTLCDVKAPVRVTSAGPAQTAEPADQAVAQAEAYQRSLIAKGLGPNHYDVMRAEAMVLQAKQRKLFRSALVPGWTIEVQPVREENGALVLEVTWPRPPFGFNKGYFVAAPVQTRSTEPQRYRVSAQPQTLTLKPGARVLLDRMSADVAPGAACNAIGIGLEIGVDSSRSAVVESEVWLVHKKPDGSETSEKQVLRTAAGAPSSYIFPKAMLGHDVYGQVSSAKTDGTLDVQLAIGGPGSTADAQMTFFGPVSASSEPGPFVSMTRVAVRSDRPAEVLSFPLAKIRVDSAKAAAKGDHEFSLRIRSRELATNK
jgi:hypothetical protein